MVNIEKCLDALVRFVDRNIRFFVIIGAIGWASARVSAKVVDRVRFEAHEIRRIQWAQIRMLNNELDVIQQEADTGYITNLIWRVKK